MHHRKQNGRWKRMVGAVAGFLAIAAVAGACGDSPSTAARATSLQDALGFDESDFQAREAKVQEEIRRCMQEQGFDYVPVDASQMRVERRGPGTDDTAEFRRTKGYGVTTRFGAEPDAMPGGDSDPNQKIREALSEADRAAYDKALFGSASDQVGPGGEFAVRIGPGGVAKAGEARVSGCFGQAQEKAGEGGNLRELGPQLQELEERISSDPRMVKANAAWSACMSDAGFDYEKPEDIVPYLFERLQELQGGPDDNATGGGIGAVPVPPTVDSPELDALRAEELALAKADNDCSTETGRRATATKVREEAERQFLEDNPNLGADGDGSDGGKG